MSYKDQLHEIAQQQQNDQANRVQEITQDVKDVFNDGSVFGQLVADSVGEALGKTIGTVAAKTEEVIKGAVENALQSDQFTASLGEQLGWKEAERQQVNTNVPDREMG